MKVIIFEEAQEIVPIIHPEPATRRSSIKTLLLKTKQSLQENTLRTLKITKFSTVQIRATASVHLRPAFILP